MDLGSWSAVAVWGTSDGSRTAIPSKRDAWLTAMIWIGAIMCVVGGVAQLSGPAGPMQKGLVLVLLVGGASFLLWMLYGTSYTFSPAGLHIRCGPVGILVPLSQIGSVVPSRSMFSGPACSLEPTPHQLSGGVGAKSWSPPRTRLDSFKPWWRVAHTWFWTVTGPRDRRARPASNPRCLAALKGCATAAIVERGGPRPARIVGSFGRRVAGVL